MRYLPSKVVDVSIHYTLVRISTISAYEEHKIIVRNSAGIYTVHLIIVHI